MKTGTPTTQILLLFLLSNQCLGILVYTSPENQGLGRESIELQYAWGWKGLPKESGSCMETVSGGNLSFGQQHQTCLWLSRKIRVKVQLLVDRQRRVRAVACVGLKESELLVVACP